MIWQSNPNPQEVQPPHSRTWREKLQRASAEALAFALIATFAGAVALDVRNPDRSLSAVEESEEPEQRAFFSFMTELTRTLPQEVQVCRDDELITVAPSAQVPTDHTFLELCDPDFNMPAMGMGSGLTETGIPYRILIGNDGSKYTIATFCIDGVLQVESRYTDANGNMLTHGPLRDTPNTTYGVVCPANNA